MANAEKLKMVQWHYCSVCRRNHDEGKKHKYSKQHKSKLGLIMQKFSKKVRSARRTLTKPSVLEGELEPGAKMWCYCCEEEIEKHVTNGSVSIEWGGLIEHLSSSVHHKKARLFWWVHGAEENQLQTFLLFPIEYRRYKELVEEALSSLEERRERHTIQIAEELRAKEQLQSQLAMEPPPSKHSGTAILHQTHQKQYRPSLDETGTTGAITAASSRGNVHTGATPPWLREDDEDSSGHVTNIGPSLEEFIKHKERLRHAGKNPRRVGADFHLQLALQRLHREGSDEEDDDWLPSFGRVWNHGPRLHSKNEYLRENKKIGTSSETSAGDPNIKSRVQRRPTEGNDSSQSVTPSSLGDNSPSSSLSSPPKIKPYVRKRPFYSEGTDTETMMFTHKAVTLTDSGITRLIAGVPCGELETERHRMQTGSHKLQTGSDSSSLIAIQPLLSSTSYNYHSSYVDQSMSELASELIELHQGQSTSTQKSSVVKPYVRKRTLKPKITK